MPRGVGYDSLAALVDYLTKEEEDRQVPLSALADAARQGIGQGVVDPVVDFVGAGQLGRQQTNPHKGSVTSAGKRAGA